MSERIPYVLRNIKMNKRRIGAIPIGFFPPPNIVLEVLNETTKGNENTELLKNK